jgi:hypothetical protein
MALIACPDCSKGVSDQAPVCPYCGLPVAAHFRRIREEEEARKAEEEARLAEVAVQRSKELQTTVIVVIGVVLFFFIIGGLTNSHPQTSVLYELDNQTVGATPGTNAFSASGKMSLVYSCHSNGKASTTRIQITLVDVNTQLPAWKKSLVCPINGSSVLQVKASSYDIGVSIRGNGAWTLKITQP